MWIIGFLIAGDKLLIARWKLGFKDTSVSLDIFNSSLMDSFRLLAGQVLFCRPNNTTYILHFDSKIQNSNMQRLNYRHMVKQKYGKDKARWIFFLENVLRPD